MKIKYLVIGGLLDLFDFIGVGILPILGDVVDFFSAIYWYTIIGKKGFISLIELVPFLDILPTNIVLGYFADKESEKK